VAVRTYTAAYEWDVPDGDVVRAITTTAPRVTPLPDDVQGEAIAYTVDGGSFLTLSDQPGPTEIRRYPRDAGGGPTPTALATVAASDMPGPMTWYGVALAAVGASVLLGALATLLARRRR
jgi:hypothetical protein